MRIFNSKAMMSLGLILGMTLLFQNCGKGFGSLKAGKQLLGSTGLRTSSVVLCPANYTKQGELCIPPSTDRVGGTHFGILYMLWHCPFSQSSQNPSGQIFDLSQLLPQGQTGPIGGWHWWDRPADRGYYCLSENNEVLKKHAIELRDAGIDFIVVDSTNHPTTDGQSDRPQEMIVRPFANLLRVWSEIPGAPRVVPWVPVTNHTQPMVDHLLGLLANYPHLQYIKDGKPYFLATNNPAEVLKVNGAKLSQLAMNYSYDKMWAINTKTLEPKEFSYLSPCRGDFKASGGTTTCDQFITSHNGIKEHVSISAGVNQFLMSEPTQSTPRFQGRTLARQFETLFKNPEIRLATITSYNEWLAINHCAAQSGGLTGDPNQCSSPKPHFVDLYNGEYSRDIEPSTTLGDKYYRLTKACISRFKRGMTTCDANSADEVRSVPMGETMADSVERACSYPGHTNLPAQITTGQVFGFMDRIRWSNGRAVLGGWACRVGDAREIDVHVYLDGPAGKGVFSKTGKTQISSEAAIHAACGTPEGIKHRFEVDVTDLVGTSSGRSIYVHAIDPQGGANYFLHNSGSCAVPWPGVDTPPPMPQYSWAVSDWSGCSSNPQWQVSAWSSCMNGSMSRTVSCNGRDGQDSRQVVCRRDDGQVVADNFCAGSKPEMSKSCQKECSGATPSTMQPCEEAVKFTYDWDVGAWGSCSAMPSWELGAWSACTGGTQTRPVACIHTLGLQQRNVQCRRSDGVMVTSGCSGAMPSREMECRSTCQSMAPEASRSCSMPEIPKVTIHRLYQPTGIEHLFSTNANEGASAGFVYEGAPFRLYQRQESSTVALHRCWVPGWKHFVTTDGNCEGQQKDGILGYISTVEIPGTVPLYRRYHPTVQDHLVTTFRNEGAEAGYIEVSVLGYVFTP